MAGRHGHLAGARAYRAQLLLWTLGGIGLVVLMFTLVGLLLGCADVHNSVARAIGCDPVAVERGYCTMPKEVTR